MATTLQGRSKKKYSTSASGSSAPNAPAIAVQPGQMDRLAAWARRNTRVLLIITGVVVAGGLLTWFMITAQRRKQEFASRALVEARSLAENGNIAQASSRLQQVIDTYSGTDAAQEAEISLNQLRLVNGQAELAAVRLREFIARSPAPRYLAPAEALLGSALENAGKPADAAAAYQKAADATSTPYLKADYLLDAARAYTDAGKNDAAIQVLTVVVDKYQDTNAYVEAQVRLAELTKGKM